MYSGNDSQGSQNYTQWALNPSAYQNMSNDQVDWAALAQQWIIMKEAGPPVPEQAMVAPPAPTISKPTVENLTEGGEAPMEVENEKEDDTAPTWNDGEESWNWNQQQQWGWDNSWSAPSAVPPPPAVKTPLLPTPPSFNQYVPSYNCSNNQGYNTVAPGEFSGGYWTAAGTSKIKPHNKRYSKVNVPVSAQPVPQITEPVTLDAAKRKQLPAWIREGLEKMERDKQRQIEKERERQVQEEYVETVKFSEKDALEILQSAAKERDKNKFEIGAEDSDTGSYKERSMTPEVVPLTQEEMMLKVRRTMTEILLNVTNREILTICKEELQRYFKKIKASDQRVSAPSGTNLTSKLGLGMYGGGSGTSSDDSEDDQKPEHLDSDLELKDTIKRRRAEFCKTEREIEQRLADSERGASEDCRGDTGSADDNESQVDAKLQGRKSRYSSSRDGTPPLRTQESRHKRQHSSSSSSGSEVKRDKLVDFRDYKSDNRRSLSSDSDRSEKQSKSKYYRNSSETKRRTPDKKIKSKSRREGKNSTSKSSSFRSKRSKSVESVRRRSRSNSRIKEYKSRRESSYRRRSVSRSRRSRSKSLSRSRRSTSRSPRSYTKLRRSRSRKSRSRSTNRRSRSRGSSRRSSSRRRSRSRSIRARRNRRSRSHSSGRGKRSNRH